MVGRAQVRSGAAGKGGTHTRGKTVPQAALRSEVAQGGRGRLPNLLHLRPSQRRDRACPPRDQVQVAACRETGGRAVVRGSPDWLQMSSASGLQNKAPIPGPLALAVLLKGAAVPAAGLTRLKGEASV